ncbi:MAG: O-antigen ligase family protein [Actinomycetota bacterium]
MATTSGADGPDGPPLASRDAIGDVQAYGAPGTTVVERHETAITRITIVVVVGYLALGRGFAQLGVAPVGLFLGEVVVGAALIYRPSRRALLEFLNDLFRPGRLHLLAWATALFVASGLFAVVLGWSRDHPVLEIAKTFALTYYVLFLPLGIWLSTVIPGLLYRLVRVLAWVNLVYGLAFVAFLDDRPVFLPFSSAALGGPQGSGAAIMGILCFEDQPRRSWHLLAGNALVLLLQQKRAEWIGTGMALVVWTLWSRRYSLLSTGAVVVVAVITVTSILGIQLDGASNRGGGSVSPNAVAARLIAPLDADIARQIAPDQPVDTFAGTARWRRQWWEGIWEQVHADQTTTLIGNGHGFDLSTLTPNRDADDSRTPHNIFFYVLGYTGWLGVIAYAAFIAMLLALLNRAARITANPFGLCFFAVCLGIGLFSNFFETPFGAIPFYVMSGMAIVPGALVRSR